MRALFSTWLLLTLGAANALASPPSMITSTCDGTLVGNSSGIDRGNAFVVNARWPSGNPYLSNVVYSLSFVTTAAHLYADDEPGAVVD
jgi:hypothetical protein